jgi:hypothetical protein
MVEWEAMETIENIGIRYIGSYKSTRQYTVWKQLNITKTDNGPPNTKQNV